VVTGRDQRAARDRKQSRPAFAVSWLLGRTWRGATR
jgi:hypothetical protein